MIKSLLRLEEGKQTRTSESLLIKTIELKQILSVLAS